MALELHGHDGAWSATQTEAGWTLLVAPGWRLVGTLGDTRLPEPLRVALDPVVTSLTRSQHWNRAVVVTVTLGAVPRIQLAPVTTH